MGDYDFIIDNITFSFSNLSSFNICKYGWKLNYIEGEGKERGFFSDFGLFVHKIHEMYFKDELKQEDMAKYYEKNYIFEVVAYPPPYPKGMGENYYESGFNYFRQFSFDKSKYEVVSVEDVINSNHKKNKLVVKPDLVIKEISTGKHILVDYKTSKKPLSLKKEDNKILNYKKQMELYSQFLWKEKQIEISEVQIWFIRDCFIYSFPLDLNRVMLTLEWFDDTIKDIKNEEEWTPNNTKENKYFCNNICSVRSVCEYNK